MTRAPAWISVLALGACGPALAPEEPGERAVTQIELEGMLYGAPNPCREDEQCPGRVCTFGVCLGLLQLDERWTQETVLAELVRRSAGDEDARGFVQAAMGAELARGESDVAYRARALLALERLDAREPILAALGAADDRLQGAAALALVRLGDARGLPLAAALTEASEEALACEALWSLGLSRLPEALAPILSLLNPDLDRDLVRAAIQAAALSGDRRGIRPLVDFLPRAPETLELPVVEALRTLTQARLGRDPAAWRAWVTEHHPPDAPLHRLLDAGSQESFGLPEP